MNVLALLVFNQDNYRQETYKGIKAYATQIVCAMDCHKYEIPKSNDDDDGDDDDDNELFLRNG